MLLLYSIVVTLVLFGIYHYLDRKNSDEADVKEYNIYNELLTFKNIIVVIIIFIFIFSLLYVAFDDGTTLSSALSIFDNEYTNLNILNKSNILDKDLLKKCNDPMKAGFEPYNSNSSASSAASSAASSVSSSVSSDED